METQPGQKLLAEMGWDYQATESAARRVAEFAEKKIEILLDALRNIADLNDSPEIDATAEWQFGLHCGVEDRGCQDRYEGADYGHTVGVERALEWAKNEATYALGLIEK